MTILKSPASGLPRCKACRQSISGRYTVALEAHWHAEHFVCGGCGRAIGDASFLVHDEKPYHEACSAAFLPRCVCCAVICIGQSLRDMDQNTFCPRCYESTHGCPFCLRRLCAGMTCQICGDPVLNLDEARRNMEYMVQWVRRHGVPLRWTAEQIDLRCVRDVPGERFWSSSNGHRLGLTTVNSIERRIEQTTVREHTVSVLMKNTMPEIVFRGVAAHELGHVWMMTEGIEKVKPDESEGICELLAFLYYKSLGSAEGERHACRIRDNPDPIYGGGFRKVFALFERVGMTRVCASLTHTGGLPRITPR